MGCSDNAAPTTQNENILPEYVLKYARLDQYGRDAVEAIIRAEYNRCPRESIRSVTLPYEISVKSICAYVCG